MKKVFRYFTIFEYEKEQNWLREMHREGWKFRKVTGLGMYHFDACEPEDVVYQLDYNKDGQAHREEYLQMFRDCGWEYVQDFVGYSYFRKPVTEGEEESIFCDEESRYEMMMRVFRSRGIPLLILFLLLVFLFIMNLIGESGVAAFIGVVILLYIAIFGSFVKSWLDYRKRR